MPKETDRLKLPLPLGNENVTRESINRIFEKIDAGVATRDELEALRQVIGEMDIPDASLTQKGKVQLSNKTDGTSETVAATEKAVGDVLQKTKETSMSISGGEFTGIVTAQSNTSYTSRQIHNIILSTTNPNLDAMKDGDIWIKYK